MRSWTISSVLAVLLAASVQAADIRTIHQHKRLGFNLDDIGLADIEKGPEGDLKKALFHDVKLDLNIDLGADFDATYDRADLRPNHDVPLDIVYTPTDDPGPEVVLAINGLLDIEVEKGPCSDNQPDIALSINGSADMRAPLTGDAPIVMPVSSGSPVEVARLCVVDPDGDGPLPAAYIGVDMAIQGTFTVTPVPTLDISPGVVPALGGNILPGVGGAMGMFAVPPPNVASLGGVFPAALFPAEWQNAGQSITLAPLPPASADRVIHLAASLPPSAVAHARFEPFLHWVRLGPT
jgi:hypothetical protein